MHCNYYFYEKNCWPSTVQKKCISGLAAVVLAYLSLNLQIKRKAAEKIKFCPNFKFALSALTVSNNRKKILTKNAHGVSDCNKGLAETLYCEKLQSLSYSKMLLGEKFLYLILLINYWFSTKMCSIIILAQLFHHWNTQQKISKCYYNKLPWDRLFQGSTLHTYEKKLS